MRTIATPQHRGYEALGTRGLGPKGEITVTRADLKNGEETLQMEGIAGQRQTKRKFMDVRSHMASGLAVQGVSRGCVAPEHYQGLEPQGKESELYLIDSGTKPLPPNPGLHTVPVAFPGGEAGRGGVLKKKMTDTC